jgi:hypothetical protein
MTVLGGAGIIVRLGGTDEFARFELSEELSGQHLHHLVCTDCGLVLDTGSSPGLEAALAKSIRDVAVLERQPDSVTTFDRAAHRIAGHHPQQLATSGRIRRRDAVVGELGPEVCRSR